MSGGAESETVRALSIVAPADFVAARARLAKELKAAGRREDAEAISRLRRPRMPEHALNRVAIEEPKLVERFAATVRAAADAQRAAIEGGRGSSLRTATDQLRVATGAVAERAMKVLDDLGERGASHRVELLAVLRTIVAPAAIDQLREGLLGLAPPPEVGVELEGEPAAQRSPRRTAPKDRTDDTRRAKERNTQRKELERALRAARAELERSTALLDRAEERLGEAESSAREARVVVEHARAAAESLAAQLHELE